MKKLRTIYRHIGYYNDYESIQSVCVKKDDGSVELCQSLLEDMLFGNGYIEDLDPDCPETHLILENETIKYYLSFDKKLLFTTTSLSSAFEIDTDADDYNPNCIDCDTFIDVYEFVGVELPFSLDEFKDNINHYDDEIIIGMSYNTPKQATMWQTFKRYDYKTYDDWVNAFYREFVFQFNRKDIQYLDVVSRCNNKIFSL